MSSVPLDGGTTTWPPWARGARRPSSISSGQEVEGTYIPLADLRSTATPDSTSNGTPLVPAHPTATSSDLHVPTAGGGAPTAAPSASSSSSTRRHVQTDSSPRASRHSSSSSCSSSSSSTPSAHTPDPMKRGTHPGEDGASASRPNGEARELHLVTSPPGGVDHGRVDQPWLKQQQQQQQQPNRGPVTKPGDYLRGIAAEARAWSSRALAGGAGREDIDPVSMFLPESLSGQRVGGVSGRGPLLRRLQTAVYGMLDDFVVVTITRPGPLYVRLRPDSRGLVIVNNFDAVPDDPHTSCPRLGPVESVGAVTPGDSLASVNREVLLGRPFSECVRYIREATSSATTAAPCLLCFRKADPATLGANIEAPPRSLEQEKRRSLERLLEGGEGGFLDEAKLRGITSTGVPDAGGLRPVMWRFLLRCLPANRMQWPEHLQTQRKLYARFVQDLILKPAEIVTQGGGGCRGEIPQTNGAERVTSTARVAPASEVGSDDAGRRAQALPHRRVSGATGSSEWDATAAACVTPAEDLPRAENGTNNRVRLSQSSSERDSSSTCANDTAHSLPETTGVPSSPRSNGSEHSQGGSRAIRELRPADDDPLSNKDTSEWAALWSDKELMQAIEQDVVRTMPDLAFYACRGVEDDADSGVNGDGGGGGGGGGGDAGNEQRRRGRERRVAIARILFVHAKLNPAESYTQGMNEIVATLFYVLATDENEEWSRHCEADTFFCFTNLMAEIRDVFIQSLDDSESGLQGKMEAFSRTLRQHDPELAEHMVSLALDPRYFALRWFTTLLSREFDLPDTIRLWDSLFASQDRSSFLVFVFVTLLLAQREELLAGDFASNLQLLQAYPPTEVPDILAQSEALRLFSARGDAARAGGLREQRAREAADGAKQAAEQVNAAARRFWNAATDLAAGAAERMATMADVDGSGGGHDEPGPGALRNT